MTNNSSAGERQTMRFDLDVQWCPAGLAPGASPRGARFQVTAPSDAHVSEFLASLVVAVATSQPIACVAENAFVRTTGVARRLASHAIAVAGDGFVVAEGSVSALAMLLDTWQAEAVWMAFGGEERIDVLEAAVRGPRWWALDRAHGPLDTAGAQLGCVMRVALSHASLEAFADVHTVLRFLDYARGRIEVPAR
ncbi:hypothetical protein [Anaeromyxobacter dehalogenans]|uniref:hypothetical protein n=1 Tax=Anaeromyxobacter dehalogenans TaxID=161493 RepID=UPI000051CEF5|nr:hypothetical protein [Anaeromyxobacter dehalogenans]